MTRWENQCHLLSCGSRSWHTLVCLQHRLNKISNPLLVLASRAIWLAREQYHRHGSLGQLNFSIVVTTIQPTYAQRPSCAHRHVSCWLMQWYRKVLHVVHTSVSLRMLQESQESESDELTAVEDEMCGYGVLVSSPTVTRLREDERSSLSCRLWARASSRRVSL